MILAWAGFLILVGGLLAFDLGVLNKGDHATTVREAFRNTALFAALALAFGGVVYVAYDQQWMGLGTVPDTIDHAINTGRSLGGVLRSALIEVLNRPRTRDD